MKPTRILVLTALPLVLAACTGPKEPPTIGVLLPLSGPHRAAGEQIRDGLELELARFASEASTGEIRVEILDTEGRPNRAASLAEGLLEHGAIAFVGGVTHEEAAAIGRVASENDRIFLSLSPDDPPHHRLAFRLVPSAESVAQTLAGYMARTLDRGEVTVIRADVPDDPTDEAFSAELERNGEKVAHEVEYGPVVRDLDRLLKGALASHPRAIFVSGPARAVAEIVDGLGDHRYRGAVLTPSLLGVETLAAEDGGHRRVKTLLLGRARFEPDGDDPVAQSFVHRYQERFEERPGLYAAYGADAITLLHAAWTHERGGTRPNQLWQGLRAVNELHGVTGFLQFDEHGEISVYPRVYRVDGKQQILLGRLDLAGRERTLATIRS